MPSKKSSKKPTPADQPVDPNELNPSSSDSSSDSSTDPDSTSSDAEGLSKKKRQKKKKLQKKQKRKGKRKAHEVEDEGDEGEAATLQAAQEENERLHQELAELKVLVEQNRRDMLNAARLPQTTGAGPSNANADADPGPEQIRIPIPENKAGLKIKKLIQLLGLTDSREDRMRWLEWRDLIRHWMSMANLNYDLPWKQQDKSQLGKLYSLIRERIPQFQRFVSNWAAEYLVQDAFNHRRGHRMSKARDEDGEDEDHEDSSPRKKRKVAQDPNVSLARSQPENPKASAPSKRKRKHDVEDTDQDQDQDQEREQDGNSGDAPDTSKRAVPASAATASGSRSPNDDPPEEHPRTSRSGQSPRRGRGGAPRRQRGLNIQVDEPLPTSTGRTTRSRDATNRSSAAKGSGS